MGVGVHIFTKLLKYYIKKYTSFDFFRIISGIITISFNIFVIVLYPSFIIKIIKTQFVLFLNVFDLLNNKFKLFKLGWVN